WCYGLTRKHYRAISGGGLTFIDLHRQFLNALCDNFAVIYSHRDWLPPFYHHQQELSHHDTDTVFLCRCFPFAIKYEF
ncbi:TPA: hypothetical protein ACPZRN_003646, partial [Yersinia enterocolitica]